jgi:alpha-L-rhamnosidase
MPPSSRLSVDRLRVEYAERPLGIDVRIPRFSWQLFSSSRGAVQSAYQLQVSSDQPNFDGQVSWDSGRIESDSSVHVEYAGPDLESRQRCYWRVRVWDGDGDSSAWSEPGFWEMGLLDTNDWQASWISPQHIDGLDELRPAAMLRREFELGDSISDARIYVTSLGLYELEINGQVVGDQVFTPGWTSYGSRLQYQTYDVSHLLRRGSNAIGSWLGDGWYRGFLGWDGARNRYGDRLALLVHLEVNLNDGRRFILLSDDTWKSSTGPILASDIYMGERYDARLEQPGWSNPGFDDEQWTDVAILDRSTDILVASSGPAVRRIEEVHPVSISVAPNGNPIVDMGQNLVGRVRLRVNGPAGSCVKLRHAEVRDSDGGLYTDNLRSARQEVTYTAKGGGTEIYEPKFSFQGFRYVEVNGYPGTLSIDDVVGIVIHSDMELIGIMETSDPLINQLQHNIVWGQKGNFLDVPTDCPQRDERLGWTGDAQVFARTAAFNMQVAPFFAKWLTDLAADQLPNGSVPWVVPDVLTGQRHQAYGATGWGDAAVIIPWEVYQTQGDVRILKDQYPSMVSWIEFMRSRAGSNLIWEGDQHFGDWLAYSPGDPGFPGTTTSTDLLATAYFAHSTNLVSRIAGILGKTSDETAYRQLFEDTRAAFRTEFVTQSGRLVSETQTSYAIVLAFDLIPDAHREATIERLVADVRSFGHLTTGFLGAPLLTHVLSNNGHLDLAYDLLNRVDYPSWLYPVTKGATTIWERWDSVKADGSFQDPEMNSFNHYAYGAVGDWMYRTIGGINVDPGEPGYKHVVIRPRPGGGLTAADTRLETMYGRVRALWKVDDEGHGSFRLFVEIPANASATVCLPSRAMENVSESGDPLESVEGLRIVRVESGEVEVLIGSGTYNFEVRDREAGNQI